MKRISHIHRVKYICLFFLIIMLNYFISCKVSTKMSSKENVSTSTQKGIYKLHSVTDSQLLRRIINECDYNHIQFYGQKSKYIMYYKSKERIILHTSPSINNLLFHVENPGVVIFEDKIIFVVEYAYDNNIFQVQGNDSIVILHNYNNDNESFCFFDTLYNFISAKKLEISEVIN